MILVTGGAGYIGSHCALALLEKVNEIVIFDNLSTGHIETINNLSKYGKVNFVQGDLLNKDDLQAVFEKYEIDAVVHFAAFSQVGESVKNPEKYYNNNVCGTKNLLSVMIENNVKKIVFSSTASVYGEPVYVPVDEKHQLKPINPYGETKLIIEKIMDDYDKSYGLKSVRLRYFNVAGADKLARVGEWHDPETHLIPNILKSTFSTGKTFEMYGDDYDTKDGTCVRDYINIEDLVNAHLLALEYLNNGGKTDYFNLGTNNGSTVKEVFNVCQKVSGKDIEVKIMPRREGDPASLVADNTKAKNILGWNPQNTLEYSIETAYKWEKAISAGGGKLPKLSVLVPIYNVEKYLSVCLDSLINQTLTDIEIICIDDGSTDSSSKILKEYQQKDKRIRVITQENSGYGSAMNCGLILAEGEYIGILESDDFVDEKMYEKLYELAKKHNSDIVKSEYYEYKTGFDRRDARETNFFPADKIDKVITIKDFPSLIKFPASIWSAIYRREFLLNNNIKFRESAGASYQDTSFGFKTLASAKSIVLTSEAYLFYRKDNLNSSINSKAKVFAICDEFDNISDFLDYNSELKSILNTQKLVKQYNSYMWNLKRIDKSYRDDFIEKFSQTFNVYYKAGEITNDFYKKVRKKEFLALINDTKTFKKMLELKLKVAELKKKRRDIFSIHVGFKRLRVRILGKQIARFG